MNKRVGAAALLSSALLLSGCFGNGSVSPSGAASVQPPAQAIRADLNCDGVIDRAVLLYPQDSDQVVVELTLGDQAGQSRLRFGLGDNQRQNALCGREAGLSLQPSDSGAVAQALGEIPRGYRSAEQCYDLVLSDATCDSINLYWDHARDHLNWWRL